MDPDRFSRTTHFAIMVTDEIEAVGTKLEFIDHEYQHTDEGRLFYTLRLAIAEYEKTKILHRTASGKRRKIAQGGLPTGLNMYGYDYNKETQEVSVNVEEAGWVARIFLWASEQLGCQVIANRLNAAGVRTKRHGARWYRGTVSKILRNEGYVGRVHVNRYDSKGLGVQKQLPSHRRTKKMTPKQRGRNEWVVIPIPPLISEDLWALVNQIRRPAQVRRPTKGIYLLSGIAICGYCEGPIFYRPHKTQGHALVCGNRYPYMRDRRTPLPTCRRLPYQAAGPIEQQVWSKVEGWLTHPETLVADMESRTSGDRQALSAVLLQEQSQLVVQLEEKQREQVRVVRLVRSGILDGDVAIQELTPLKDQIEHLRSTINRLGERIEEAELNETQTATAVALVQTLHEQLAVEAQDILGRLQSLDPERKGQLVRMVVKHVAVYPKGVCDVVPVG